MNKIKAVLFDLDGTLIDSEYFYYSNWAPILENDYGLQITFDDWIRNFAGHTLTHNVEMLNSVYQLQVNEQELWVATREAYARSNMGQIRLMPFAKEILEFAKAQGWTIGLVTSSFQSTVDAVLGNHNLLDFFSFFITRESVVNPKPNPEPYLLAADRLQLAKEAIVVIEDTSTGCMAAQGAGLYCIAVSKQQVERDRLVIADALLNDLADVKNMLLNSNSI